MKFLVLGLLVAISAVILVNAKTKLPSGMSQHQYCLGCIATVKELQKLIAKRHLTAKNREEKIMDMVENICAPPNFVEYEYSPPKTVRACKNLLENHEEDLESALVKSKPDVEKLICHEVSKACEGIDTEKKNKASKFADIDLSSNEGEKVKLKTVKVDPGTGYVVEDGEKDVKKNEGKTLSKKSKKTKVKKTKKEKEKSKASNAGKEKGSLNQLNVDINDPGSMDRIMAQIKELTDQQAKENKEKEEL